MPSDQTAVFEHCIDGDGYFFCPVCTDNYENGDGNQCPTCQKMQEMFNIIVDLYRSRPFGPDSCAVCDAAAPPTLDDHAGDCAWARASIYVYRHW